MLRPGGRLLVLEFSQPRDGPFARWYDHYSFKLIPPLGRVVAGDEESYRYLVESIRRHPDQETLKDMMQLERWRGGTACWVSILKILV
jgi:demethylmenaquinone methyltransferase/2-methoxy-6-polyprenyl-1,4-benzoquinol methylase